MQFHLDAGLTVKTGHTGQSGGRTVWKVTSNLLAICIDGPNGCKGCDGCNGGCGALRWETTGIPYCNSFTDCTHITHENGLI